MSTIVRSGAVPSWIEIQRERCLARSNRKEERIGLRFASFTSRVGLQN